MSLKGRGAPAAGGAEAGAPGVVAEGAGPGAGAGAAGAGVGVGVGAGAWAWARVAAKAPATRLAPSARATAFRSGSEVRGVAFMESPGCWAFVTERGKLARAPGAFVTKYVGLRTPSRRPVRRARAGCAAMRR